MTKARIAASIIAASVLTLAGIALPAPSIASHDSSVIVGPYPGLRCDSASQAINDPEDCTPLHPLSGLLPLDSQSDPDITIAPCDMAQIPAYTRTDVCVASDGSIISR